MDYIQCTWAHNGMEKNIQVECTKNNNKCLQISYLSSEVPVEKIKRRYLRECGAELAGYLPC